MEQTFELYKGKIKGKFLGPTEDAPSRHMYYIEGKRKTGVTTYLNIKDKSTALLSWSREQIAAALLDLFDKKGAQPQMQTILNCVFEPERTLAKAGDIGSKIHDWIEGYIKHRLKEKGYEKMPEMPEDQNVLTGVTSFLEWESAHKVKFLWSEKILYSRKYDYIGRGDFAAKVDGEVCLCDIKTGNGMYNSVRAQTAAYAMADTEECGQKYSGRWAIRIAKESPEDYDKRIALKNKIKGLLGQSPSRVEPYQVFEAKFLDNEKSFMKRDFDGYLTHMALVKWDKDTDFYKEKNAIA
jgi:hypothetical protein